VLAPPGVGRLAARGSHLSRLDDDVEGMKEAMREASRVVLDGVELNVDAIVVWYPDRYRDKRGVIMWERVMGLLDKAA
jgi:DNA polymerase I